MKKIQKKIDKPFRIKTKNPSTSFAYNQVPRSFPITLMTIAC